MIPATGIAAGPTAAGNSLSGGNSPSPPAPAARGDRHVREVALTALLLAGILLILFRDAIFLGRALLPVDLIYFHDPVWQAAAPPGQAGPSNPLQSDVVYQFYPWRVFVARWLAQGVLPLWNPLILGGASFVGNDQSALFYPINVLTYLVPPTAAPLLSAILRLLVAGLSTYGYLRVSGRSVPAARLGAVAFMLCGWIVAWLSWPHVNVAVWLPAILLFIEVIFRNGSWLWAGPLALVIGSQFLGGHVETSFHLGLVSAAYLAFLVGRTWRRDGARRAGRGGGVAAAGAALGTGIGAIQLLPFLEALTRSTIAVERATTASGGLSLYSPEVWRNLLALPTLVVPLLLGSPAEPGYWAFEFTNYNEYVLYVGIVPFVFALVGLGDGRRDGRAAFWAGAAVFSLGVAYRAPIFEAVNHLPLFGIAANGRLRLIFSFAIICLAAGGLDRVLTDPRARPAPPAARPLAHAVWLAAAAGLLSLTALVATFFTLVFWHETWLALARRYVESNIAGRPEFPNSLEYYTAKTYEYFDALVARFTPFYPKTYAVVAAALVLAALLWLARQHRIRARPLGHLSVFIASIELIVYGSGYNPAIDPAQVFPSTPVIDFLRERAGSDRIIGLGFALMPNSGMIWGLNDLRGYEVVRPERSWNLLRAIEDRQQFGDYLLVSSLESPLVDLFGVRYAVGGPEAQVGDPGRWQRVFEDSGLTVFENRRSLPRARVVYRAEVLTSAADVLDRLRAPAEDLGSVVLLEADQNPPAIVVDSSPVPARIADDRPGRVAVEATLDSRGYLILSDTYDEGWEAFVDGQRAAIYRANYAFRAVALPPGPHRIELVYGPRAFAVGSWITIVGLMAVALMVLVVPALRWSFR